MYFSGSQIHHTLLKALTFCEMQFLMYDDVADLAGKYRGLEFTRHLFEGHDDGDECDAARSIRNLSSGDLFENPEQSFRITKTSTVKSSWMARGFLGVWAVMLVLPEDVQGLVLEDLMMVLTYIVTLVKDGTMSYDIFLDI